MLPPPSDIAPRINSGIAPTATAFPASPSKNTECPNVGHSVLHCSPTLHLHSPFTWPPIITRYFSERWLDAGLRVLLARRFSTEKRVVASRLAPSLFGPSRADRLSVKFNQPLHGSLTLTSSLDHIGAAHRGSCIDSHRTIRTGNRLPRKMRMEATGADPAPSGSSMKIAPRP